MQVDGISVAAAEAIQAKLVVSGYLAPATGHLILVLYDDTVIDAGMVTHQEAIDLADIDLTGTLAEFNAGLSDANFTSLAGVETLTNKTLVSPIVEGLTIQNPGIQGIGETRYVSKSTLETVANSTVLQDDDELFFSVVANATYLLDVTLLWTGPIDSGLHVHWSGPVGILFDGSTRKYKNPTSGIVRALTWQQDAAPDYDDESDPDSGVAVTVMIQENYLIKTVGTAGDVALSWAQTVSDAIATRIKKGSFISVRRVA